MDTDSPHDPAETPDNASPEKKDGAITFTIVMMLLALACVGITAAIAFYDMSH